MAERKPDYKVIAEASSVLVNIYGQAIRQIAGTGAATPELFAYTVRQLSRTYTNEGGVLDRNAIENGLRPSQIRRIKERIVSCVEGEDFIWRGH